MKRRKVVQALAVVAFACGAFALAGCGTENEQDSDGKIDAIVKQVREKGQADATLNAKMDQVHIGMGLIEVAQIIGQEVTHNQIFEDESGTHGCFYWGRTGDEWQLCFAPGGILTSKNHYH